MPNCPLLPHLLCQDDYKNYTEFWHAVRDEILHRVVGLTFHRKIICLQNPGNYQTIWHIITKGTNSSHHGRSIDRERAEHVPWISFLLSEACELCDSFLIWRKRHKGAIRWCVYCPKEKYVVILEERGYNELILITAFLVTPQRDHDFQKEYRQYVKNGI